MKKLFFLLSILFSFTVYAQQESHNYVTYDSAIVQTGLSSEPHWIARITRPVNYFTAGNADTASRIVIIMQPGDGELGPVNGIDTNNLVKGGPHYWLAHGWDGGVQLGNGRHYPIYITLIVDQANVFAIYERQLVDSLRRRFKARGFQVNVMGLSKGGINWGRLLTYTSTDGKTYGPGMVKAAVFLQGCAADAGDRANGFSPTGFTGFGIWAHRDNGRYFGVMGSNDAFNTWNGAKNIKDTLTAAGLPNTAFFTIETLGPGANPAGTTGSHCCWNTMIDTPQNKWVTGSYIGTNTNFPNQAGNYYEPGYIYQWILRQQTDTSLIGSGMPIANAGTDQSINLPINTTTLNGTGTPQGGHTITGYGWAKISGPSGVSITSPTSASTGIIGLVAGVYDFRLTVTDNASQTATDDIIVTVNATVPPTVSAGTDLTITLPTSSASPTGTATGNGGASIVTVGWIQLSGPRTATITNGSTLTPTFSALTLAGTYVFQLTATDDNSNSSSDQMAVIVIAGAGTKHSPYPVGVGEYQTFFTNPSGVAYGLSAVASNIGRSSHTKGILNLVPVTGGMTFIDVYGTLHGGGGVNTTHHAVTWGDNASGQAGNGTTTGFAPFEILVDSSGVAMSQIDDMRNYFVGNADVGWTAWHYGDAFYKIWGGTRTGIRGDGTLGSIATTTPITINVPNGEHISDIRSGYFLILLTIEGHVYTCGGGNLTSAGHSSNYSNLGYAFTSQNTDYLTLHKLNLTGIRQIAGGMNWNYAVDSVGKVFGWGQYRHYMGYNTTGNLNTPTDVTSLITAKFYYFDQNGVRLSDNSGIKQIITNSNGTYAISNLGHLYWWGDNAQGCGGHGTELNYFLTANPFSWPFTDGLLMDYSPILITNKSDWAWISAASPFVFQVWVVDSTGHYAAAGRNKADPIPNQLLTATSQQESTFANWGDLTWLTPQDPFGVVTTYLTTCPYCIPNPTNSTCVLYTNPANTPPVVNPGPTINVNAGATITLDASASTDNVFIGFYEWTQLSGPSTSRILVNAAKVTTADNLVNGTYIFQLKVIDNGWLQNTAQLIVNVGSGIPCPSQFCNPSRKFSIQRN